jgi:SPP1 gp7 family putative phage head morphogenesis protein
MGAAYSDRALRALEKRLNSVYSEVHRTVTKRESSAFDRLAAFNPAALREAGMTETQIRTEAILLQQRVERETRVAARMAAELADAGRQATRMIQGEMLNVYGRNLDWGRYAIDRQVGLKLSWEIYDRRQLTILMTKQQPPFAKLAYNRLGQYRVILQRLQNQLMQATILGENKQQLTGRVRQVTGQSYKQARCVAQTERTRVQSQARYQGVQEAAEMGIAMEKQWISRMDSIVRDDHAAVTGEVVDYEQPFSNGLMFPGDPDGEAEEVINCRCVLKPMVKSVPPGIRAHREKMNAAYGFDEWRASRGTG